MAWQQIKKLNEERGQIMADMKAILTKAQDEKRDLSAEENAKFDEMSAKAEAKQAESQRHQKLYDMEQSGKGKGEQRQQPGREATNTDEQRTEAEAKEQRAAFDAYLRRGAVPQDGEHRSLTTSGAGIVGDRPVYNQLVVSLKSFAGVRMAGATILSTTDGNDLSVPKSDDTSNEGQIVGEGSEDTTAADPTVGVITLKAYKFDSKWIKVSLEMLQDAAYPLESHILGIAGERIGRSFNSYGTTGTGTGQPKGILVAGTLGKTAADDAAITYEEMLDLIHSVDAGYRNLPGFRVMLHDTTLAAVRKMTDSEGRYLFSAGAAGAPGTVLGYQYVVNNSMPELSDGVGSKVIAAGDFGRYFVRDVNQVTVVRAEELFIASGLVGFRVFSRHDGNLADANAIKYLALAAS